MIFLEIATAFLLFVNVVAYSIRYGRDCVYDTGRFKRELVVLACCILAFVLSITGLVFHLITISHQK